MDEQVVTPSNPFTSESWSDTIPEQQEQKTQVVETKEEPIVEKKETVVQTQEQKEEVLEPNDYLKNKFGWDNEEAAEAEIKTLREKADKGFEYKNDESKKLAEYINEGKIDDLYSLLSTQKKIEKLATADVTDKNVAAELVKFGIQKDNPNLDESEVDFLFNEKYSLPAKPIQTELEDDDDFKIREAEWQTKVNNIEKRLVIEAKVNQPKMAQLKAELVLPDIPKAVNSEPTQPSQEELAKVAEVRTNFLNKLESDSKSFNGFEVRYKDEEGEIPINYVVSDEQKNALKEEIKDFNIDGFIDERWFKDGQPNIKQIMEDIELLKNRDSVFQKLVNETGAQIRKQYIGIKANVNVTGAKTDGVKDNSQKTELDKQIEFLWNQK